MSKDLKFVRNCQNVEIFRIHIDDPIDGKRTLVPTKTSRLDIEVGGIVISTETGEITADGDIITVKPTVENISKLRKRTFYKLVIYEDGEKQEITNGYITIGI
jgi:hypothetical protein